MLKKIHIVLIGNWGGNAMKHKYEIVLFVLINVVSTIVSILFLIHGKFKTNYGLELLGLQSSVISLLLIRKDKEKVIFYDKMKIVCYVFITINVILDVIFLINSIINYPHFFWWQNFQ